MHAANLCEGVAATVFLQHCHSDDMKIRTEATGEYKTAMDFLRKASRPFPALLSAVTILKLIFEFFLTFIDRDPPTTRTKRRIMANARQNKYRPPTNPRRFPSVGCPRLHYDVQFQRRIKTHRLLLPIQTFPTPQTGPLAGTPRVPGLFECAAQRFVCVGNA